MIYGSFWRRKQMSKLIPTAYIKETVGGTYLSTTPISKDLGEKTDKNIPLYTKEQLQPRVKMTKDEFEEWKELYYRVVELSLTACKMLNEISDNAHNSVGKYTKLAKRVYQDNDFMSVSKKQAELAGLFVNYNTNEPEETIEIVPEKKWFVRSEDKDKSGVVSYSFLMVDEDMKYGWYPFVPKYEATQFDTKEQAEEWTNPLTKAVPLPVEEE